MVMAAKSVTNGGHHPVSHTTRYPHSAIEAGMTRTFYPKYASYMGDGSGRDSYVTVNNGGLTSNEKSFMMWRPARVPKSVNPRPFKMVPALNYRSDGSGRDSYVIQNNGGLVSDFRCTKPDQFFIGGLRQHNTSPLRNSNERWKGPDSTDFLNWMCPKDQSAQRLAAKRQSEVTKRLSPAKIHTKYANFGNQDGFATSKSGRGARNLSHMEKVEIVKQQTSRRQFGTRRHTEAIASAGQQAMKEYGGTLKRNQLDQLNLDDDIQVIIKPGSMQKLNPMSKNYQTMMAPHKSKSKTSGLNTPADYSSLAARNDSKTMTLKSKQMAPQLRSKLNQTADPEGRRSNVNLNYQNQQSGDIEKKRMILQNVGLNKLNRSRDVNQFISDL